MGTYFPERLLFVQLIWFWPHSLVRLLCSVSFALSLLKWISQVNGRSYLQSLLFKGESKHAESWAKNILNCVLNYAMTLNNLENEDN
jgi:hypothetical protein